MTVCGHLPLDPCENADLELTGRISGFDGLEADFRTVSFAFGQDRTAPGSMSFPADPACEYFFVLDGVRRPKGATRMEYSGKAFILDRMLMPNNLPGFLRLRFSLPSRIRPLRRHPRKSCSRGLEIIPGLVLVEKVPQNRSQLVGLLHRYYKSKNRPRPVLVNISAGGACVRTADQIAQRLMGTEESYLFFFFLKTAGREMKPWVFLGRKVGVSPGLDGGGLRIQFMRELVWQSSSEELVWRDICSEGSEKLARELAKPGSGEKTAAGESSGEGGSVDGSTGSAAQKEAGKAKAKGKKTGEEKASGDFPAPSFVPGLPDGPMHPAGPEITAHFFED